jgi:hypothetical protein
MLYPRFCPLPAGVSNFFLLSQGSQREKEAFESSSNAIAPGIVNSTSVPAPTRLRTMN